jgi:PAN domain
MPDEPKHGSFWSTIPGVLTGLAAIVSAGTGLYLATRPSTPPHPSEFTGSPVAQQPPPTATSTTQHLTGPMGPLERGVSYNGGDLYDRPADNPEACAQLCANDDRCRAVTFIISQKRCWVKERINASAPSVDMVSSRKQA